MAKLFSFLIIFVLVPSCSLFLQPNPTCPNCPACQNANGCPPAVAPEPAAAATVVVTSAPAGAAAVEATTAVVEESTTLDFYSRYWQAQGWKTDDNGNVYVGDDNNKLLLIQMGSYCPEALCKGWFGIW